MEWDRDIEITELVGYGRIVNQGPFDRKDNLSEADVLFKVVPYIAWDLYGLVREDNCPVNVWNEVEDLWKLEQCNVELVRFGIRRYSNERRCSVINEKEKGDWKNQVKL